MNPLDQLLQALFGQAQARPDIGAKQPVATFAGRVVHPGDTTQSALARMPMGSGEGDLSTALQTTLGALAQPTMTAGGKLLATKLLAMMVPSGRVFHGSPMPFGKIDLSNADPNSLVGPGHYVTSSPSLASEYAGGATAQSLENLALQMREPQPNVRPYQMQAHNSLVTNMPVSESDIASVLKALQQREFAPKTAKHGTITPEQQRSNAVAGVESSVLPEASPGQQLWDALTRALGPQGANDTLRSAGFQSIQYPGGRIMGSEPHQATAVLDPSILQNYFDFAAKQR